MAFSKLSVRKPVAIEELDVRIRHRIDAGVTHQSALYYITIRYDDGSKSKLSGDLVPHVTSAQITALRSFMESLRKQAETQLLPE